MLHIEKIKLMEIHRFRRQYGYSTLKYFHKEMGLKEQVYNKDMKCQKRNPI